MCGRIAQPRSLREYAERLPVHPNPFPKEPIGTFNGSPGARHWLFRLDGDSLLAEHLPWGYLSGWARSKNLAPAINAQREKLAGGYYRGLMTSGRVIVPADGWYEWTGEKRARLPWYIRARSGEALFFAALTDIPAGVDASDGGGFVIVTDAAAGGMVDVHDRRPVALNAEDARLWLDPATGYQHAAEIARTGALREERFEWYRVGTTVNRAGPNSPDLIEPVEA